MAGWVSHPLGDVDRNQYFNVAIGSALECAACLDVLAVRQQTETRQIEQGKRILARVVPLVLGLRG